MKLESSASGGRRKASNRSLGGRLLRWGLAGLGAAVVLAVVIVMANPTGMQRAVAALEARWGAQLTQYDRPLAEKLSVVIGNVLRQANPNLEPLPELTIDVPFKEMRKIYAKREEALQRGKLVQAEDDFVKAEIRYEGRTIPIKMRLKGDWNDHLAGRKWSFRIHVRKGQQLFGMRRFSIQSPATRGFQSELMYFEALRRFGIMSPRYSFVDVTLNGEPMGIMAVEEFFSKELLEYNRRRESVIVRFDESLVWDATDSLSGEPVGWKGSFDHFSNAPVDAFGSGKIAESALMAEQYRVAEGLLRGFVDRRVTASEVFDVKQMGQFLAVSDMFGAWHPVAWTNLRFYLNPVTLRLEPIAFDATLQKHFEGAASIINDEPFVLQLLEDEALLTVYRETLETLQAELASGELQSALRDVEANYLPLLQAEFRLLSAFPLDYLAPRVDALLARFGPEAVALDNEFYLFWPEEQGVYPRLAHFATLAGSSPTVVELTTAIPREVELVSLYWARGDETRAVGDVDLPLVLPPRGIGSRGRRLTVETAERPEGEGWQLMGSFRLRDRPWQTTMAAAVVNPILDASPIPDATIEDVLVRHAFLQKSSDGFVVGPGQHPVTGSLILPEGQSLTLQAGAELWFAADAVMVVRGPLQVEGNADQKVRLGAADGEGWRGLIVMNAGAPSRVDNLEVSNTTGVRLDGWNLTGGVNFYASDVTILNSLLLDAHGEDSLNIIQSTFEIRDSEIRGTASDAFDSDFSEGLVINSRFIDIGRAGGGDAVDVSGTKVTVQDSLFVDVSDKALSVGERSQMEASGVTLRRVGTGAAAKDGSSLTIRDSRIENASFAGLTAYIKKPEYGPARIDAASVAISSTERSALAQTGSEVSIDGSPVPAEDVDVDALYDTIMRKGFTR